MRVTETPLWKGRDGEDFRYMVKKCKVKLYMGNWLCSHVRDDQEGRPASGRS